LPPLPAAVNYLKRDDFHTDVRGLRLGQADVQQGRDGFPCAALTADMNDEEFLLSPASAHGYLARRGFSTDQDSLTIRELGGGVSNFVLLIEWANPPGRRWVAKQSLGKLRVKEDWRSDRSRIFREAEAIRALQPLLGDSVPEVIHIDRENYLFLMTAAPTGSTAWKDSLLRGEAGPAVACQAGRLLARLITGAPAASALERRFEDRTVFDQLRIDPYYRTAATRNPDVARELLELIADSWEIRTALVHGDYSPKNMLVRGDHLTLIDFEVVHWGDPAFDCGFLLNHLLLKALYQPQFRQLYIEAAREFWKALATGLGPRAGSDFERMTTRHLGALMLARIDGKSPVEYIHDEATKEQVRRLAKRVLLERPEGLQEVLGWVRAETCQGTRRKFG
jgi:aminoglycoside phosphotransferase (APT) family kinase protein